MHPNLIDDPTLNLSEGVEPLYFTSGTHTLFGWLHLPRGKPPTGIGLVVCQPFGYEAICSHASLRVFAEEAAGCGAAVLRFDYLGTGNSAEIDPNADQLEQWSLDTAAAVEELKRRTGIERVCLLSFRLGCIVAVLTAARCPAVTALIAVAPVISGKRYLRELRTIQMAAASQRTAAASGEAPGSLEVSGFTLRAATISALSQIELTGVPLPQVADVLLIDRKELPGAHTWADALLKAGVKTEYLALPGFVRMMMTAPHFSAVPQIMLGAMRAWLERFVCTDRPIAPQSAHLPAAELELTVDGPAGAAHLRETAVRLSAGAELFAILTEPESGTQPRGAVILLNAGATHHIGPNRMYVTLARSWAQRGFIVLRMDLAGLGDSGTRRDRPRGEVYPAAALEDIRAAFDFIRSRYGDLDVTLGGLCSGAYHSLRAAGAALAVKRIMIVNPLNFRWRGDMTLQDLTWLGFVHNPRSYLEQVIPGKFWKKLVTGRLNVPRLLRLYAQHFLVLADSGFRNGARALHLPLPRDLGYELQSISRRGVEVSFLFARGDPGVALLKHQAGSALLQSDPSRGVHFIEGADHIFSQSSPRKQLEAILTEQLDREQTS